MTKHAGEAGVAATWERYRDGAVALRLRWPAGHAPGATMIDAVRWGLTLVRWAEANARVLRERHAGAPCVCGVGEGTGHAWACERVWTELGLRATMALAGCTCDAAGGHALACARVWGEQKIGGAPDAPEGTTR